MVKLYAPKKASLGDWHPADIQAALKKRGWTFRKLSIAHGYEASAAKKALARPWPRVERIIARAIGVEPWEIWPSRYVERIIARAIGVRRRLADLKSTKPAIPINVNRRGAR